MSSGFDRLVTQDGREHSVSQQKLETSVIPSTIQSRLPFETATGPLFMAQPDLLAQPDHLTDTTSRFSTRPKVSNRAWVTDASELPPLSCPRLPAPTRGSARPT